MDRRNSEQQWHVHSRNMWAVRLYIARDYKVKQSISHIAERPMQLSSEVCWLAARRCIGFGHQQCIACVVSEQDSKLIQGDELLCIRTDPNYSLPSCLMQLYTVKDWIHSDAKVQSSSRPASIIAQQNLACGAFIALDLALGNWVPYILVIPRHQWTRYRDDHQSAIINCLKANVKASEQSL